VGKLGLERARVKDLIMTSSSDNNKEIDFDSFQRKQRPIRLHNQAISVGVCVLTRALTHYFLLKFTLRPPYSPLVSDSLITDTPGKGSRPWSKPGTPKSPYTHGTLGDISSPSPALHASVGGRFAPTSRDWSPFLRGGDGSDGEILTFPDISTVANSPLPHKLRFKQQKGRGGGGVTGSPGPPLTPGLFTADEDGGVANGSDRKRRGSSVSIGGMGGSSARPPSAPHRGVGAIGFTGTPGKTSQSLLNYFKLDAEGVNTGILSPNVPLDLSLMDENGMSMNISGSGNMMGGLILGGMDDEGHDGHRGLNVDVHAEGDDSNLTLSSSEESGGSMSSGKGRSKGGKNSMTGNFHGSSSSGCSSSGSYMDLTEKERKELRAQERAQQKEQKARRAEAARVAASHLTEKARNNLRMRTQHAHSSTAGDIGGVMGTDFDAHAGGGGGGGGGGDTHGGDSDSASISRTGHYANGSAVSVALAGFGSPPSMSASKHGREASGMNLDSISPHSTKPPADDEVRCNCRRSRCLKLYCDCFRKQHFCTGDCRCSDCENNLQYEESRTKAIRQILEGRPDAFKPRVDASADGHGGVAHLNGCHCKKSACLKKYCECFGAKVFCGEKCRCSNCKNTGPELTLTLTLNLTLILTLTMTMVITLIPIQAPAAISAAETTRGKGRSIAIRNRKSPLLSPMTPMTP